MPVLLFEGAAETFAAAGIETLAKGRRRVERAEHVGGNGRVVNICASGNRRKEKFGECECEGVAHGVDEDIWNEKGESVVSENDGAYRLAQERKARPGGAEDVVSGREVEEDNGWGV